MGNESRILILRSKASECDKARTWKDGTAVGAGSDVVSAGVPSGCVCGTSLVRHSSIDPKRRENIKRPSDGCCSLIPTQQNETSCLFFTK